MPIIEPKCSSRARQGRGRSILRAEILKQLDALPDAISPANKSDLILDDDGEYTSTVRDADTLDACYHHSFPTSRVVGCWPLKRSKS